MAKFEFSMPELEQMQKNPWLTDRERRVFNLYYRRGWAIEDIAAELDVHRRTVDNVLSSIRQKSIEYTKVTFA